MKYRNGFVSNSSTSSFIILGYKLFKNENTITKLKNAFKLDAISSLDDIIDDPFDNDFTYQMSNNKILSGMGLRFMPSGDYESYYIGIGKDVSDENIRYIENDEINVNAAKEKTKPIAELLELSEENLAVYFITQHT